MASALLKLPGAEFKVIELRLGLNRVGRAPDNDIVIDDLSVSSFHCELVLRGEGCLIVRELGSTNGTFLNGTKMAGGEASLQAGQTLRLGEVELLIESVEIHIDIPKIDVPIPAPPVVLDDGSLVCPRHPKELAVYVCTNCREVLCVQCVHRLRRRGGLAHWLCPLCSHKCEPLKGETKKPKRSFLGFLKKTLKLPSDR